MSSVYLQNWLEVHEWRKAKERHTAQRKAAAAWWLAQRGNALMNARARRARRFIKAHNLSMVDVLNPNTSNIEYYLRDANKIGVRTRTLLARLRRPDPGPMPRLRIKRVA